MTVGPKSEWQFWAEVPPACEPHLALSKDDVRPALARGWIRHKDDGPVLCATDSYIAVCIPIKLRTETEAERETIEQRKELLPECTLPRETMEALANATHFRISNSYLEIQGKETLHPVSLGLDSSIDLSALRETNCPGGKLEEIRIDPALLSRVVQAIGAKAACLKFTAPLKAVETTSDRSPAWGIVMPMREYEH